MALATGATGTAGWSRAELLERLRLARAEYRAEVSLGWDRQRTFLAWPLALTAAVGVFGVRGLAARVTLCAAAIVAFAGVFVVVRSHGRYRAARDTVFKVEGYLGIEDLQTTGGQRQARGGVSFESYRFVDVFAAVYLVIAALDIVLAVMWV